MEILNSPNFFTAHPKTIKALYNLDTLKITSEALLVIALERYIDHNQAQDPDIAEKVRPALSHIRFLTLSAPQIAETTLLNAEDALQVVGCLPSSASLSKMPNFVSLNNQKRTLLRTEDELAMIRKLSSVYSDKFCNYCVNFNRISNHACWKCPNITPSENGTKIFNIYQKYKHVWLLDYDLDDVKDVYEVYRSWSVVPTTRSVVW